jgi:hypothetical protein
MVARGADRAAIKPLESELFKNLRFPELNVLRVFELSSALRAGRYDDDSLSRGSLRSPLATIVGPAGPRSQGALHSH